MLYVCKTRVNLKLNIWTYEKNIHRFGWFERKLRVTLGGRVRPAMYVAKKTINLEGTLWKLNSSRYVRFTCMWKTFCLYLFLFHCHA